MIIIKRIAINILSDNWEIVIMVTFGLLIMLLSGLGVGMNVVNGGEDNISSVEDVVSDVVVVNSIGGCPSSGKVSVNAVYGYSNGYFGGSRFHNGIDLNFVYNDVFSIRGGVVIFAGWDVMGGGHMMIVRSGDMDVWYAHLSNFKARVGQRVGMGDRIAISGNSGGLSTGAHLHLTIKVGGKFVNPYPYILNCVK